MKISYLDGPRLYSAFMVGGNEVIKDQKYLNKINVFPVPDSDTGTNLASTMRSIAEGAVPNPSVYKTLHSIADMALSGAQGNSGLIFAQFLHGESLFLDKVTITPDQFYNLLKTHREHPKTSQPPLKTVQNLFSFLATHYESIIVINISDKLSGAHKLSQEASSIVQNKKISVINSRHLSVSLGLVVLRLAEEISKGKPHGEIVKLAEEWILKTKIFVDIQTLKYMVRGGRVSPVKGFLAKILNLKPIVSLDSEGKGVASGKSFSRRGNMKKIMRMIKDMADKKKLWNYAIVHAQNYERAEVYAEKIKESIHRNPAYIVDISPVIGVHNGIGAVGIALMFE